MPLSGPPLDKPVDPCHLLDRGMRSEGRDPALWYRLTGDGAGAIWPVRATAWPAPCLIWGYIRATLSRR
jgi:hypothetical protein